MIAKDTVVETLGALNAATTAFGVEDADFVGIQSSGTWAGTLTFQCSLDGTNWQTMATWLSSTAENTGTTTSTTNGVWTRRVGGLRFVRVQMTAYTSGTATVRLLSTRMAK